jgi:PAS domain S-box-containing protein
LIELAESRKMKEQKRTKACVFAELKTLRRRIEDLEKEQILRREAEARADKFLRTIEATGEAMGVMTLEGIITHTNLAMDELFGFQKGGLIGKHLSMLDGSFSDKNLARYLADTLRKRKVWQGEIHNIKKNGRRFISYARLSPLRNQNGRIVNVLLTQHDITEQRRAEEALRQSEDKYRHLAESAADAIYIISTPSGFEYVNPAFEKILGYSSEEVCARNFSFLRLVHPDDAHLIHKRKKAREQRKSLPSPYVFRIITKKGDVRYVEASTVPLVGEGHKILGILRDITERKQIEDELKEYRQRLETSLEKQKMFSQKILAIREEERKNLSMILHEEVGSIAIGLSSNLAAVEQKVREGHLNEALRIVTRGKSDIKKSASRLKKIACNLRPPDIDILGLPGALREYFRQIPQSPKLRIRFVSGLPDERIDDKVAIVAYRIAQEATNNIIRHSQASDLSVTLSSKKHHLHVCISDNGRGFNLDKEIKSNIGHIGLLGMKEMAESLGGKLTIRTERGKGTRILVDLPFRARLHPWA